MTVVPLALPASPDARQTRALRARRTVDLQTLRMIDSHPDLTLTDEKRADLQARIAVSTALLLAGRCPNCYERPGMTDHGLRIKLAGVVVGRGCVVCTPVLRDLAGAA